MANLGDINGDGFDGKMHLLASIILLLKNLGLDKNAYYLSLLILDVAISAPFSETGSSEPGTVYIYHSTPTLLLSNEPQQVCEYSTLAYTET